MDLSSPLLTIIKEEPDLTIIKTEFNSASDLYNVEKMDLEEDVNRADPFLAFNNNYQALMHKDHTKDTKNQIYCGSLCPNCGHQFASKFVGSDFVFSKTDVCNPNGVPESCLFEPVINIEIDESNINSLLNSNIQWWTMDVLGKLDRNVMQTDNVARAIYNQGLRDGCKLLHSNNEHKLVEIKRSPEPVMDYTKCHFESAVMGLPETSNVQYNDNKESTILSSTKRKLTKKKCQQTAVKTDETQNVPVWNEFTLDQEMPYLPLPALKLMSGAELMSQSPNISKNKTSSRVNVKQQTKCTIPFQSVSSLGISSKKLCNTVINKNKSFQKGKSVIPLTVASLLKEIDIS